MAKQKLLFITPSLCQGGIERSQIIVLQMLDATKYDLTLMIYRDDVTLLPYVPDYVKFVRADIQNHIVNTPKGLCLVLAEKIATLLHSESLQIKIHATLQTYKRKRQLSLPQRRLFRGQRFDVVISNAIGICSEMALHIPAERHIVWYHASVDMHHDLLSRIFPQFDDIIAVSTGVKEMLAESYPHVLEKICVVKNYVSGEEIRAKSEVACMQSIPQGVMTLCSCGRFTPEKGFDLAVEAARILRDSGVRFVWYFIGDGDDRKKLETQIAADRLQNEICITGFTDNPFPLMKRCDVYVQPSYEEAFGRTIKEALILGRKVVSTDTAGGREILGCNEFGLLTPITAEGLADGIQLAFDMTFRGYTTDDNRREEKEFREALDYYFSKAGAE